MRSLTPDADVKRPTLSVTCMTAGPGPRVAALLRLFRPVADELVVALDDRADAATEAALAAVADTLVRYRYREPVDRPLRWLHSLPQSDWNLNVDDDEVPSAELLARLPGLVAAPDVTHYWIRRSWLWPDAEHAISDHPWRSDYQLRLVLNDARLLRFPSETHRPIDALGPHRFVRAPIYHADVLLNSLERRQAKARKYEALRPGKRVGGGPMNHVLHLPERRPGLGAEPLPDADAAAVRAVLDAPAPADPAPADTAPTVADDEIDALWAGRPLADSDYDARIELLEEPARLLVDEQRTFDVRVRNLGSTPWPWGEEGEPEVRLGYHWDDEPGIRTAFPADVPADGSIELPLHVLAPPPPGRRRLRVDLVHEHVRWFGCAVERDVEIVRPSRVAILGRDEPTLDRLTDEAPAVEPVVLDAEPAPRFGPPQAPDLRRYLFDGTVHGRRRDFPVIAARTVALLHAARRLRAGEPGRPLLRGGQEFLEAVAGATHVLVVAPPAPGLRERWLRLATLAAARVLGARPVNDVSELG